jgi:hypothetical protein
LSCNAQVKVASSTAPTGCVALGTPSATANLPLGAALKGKFIVVKTVSTNAIGSTATYSASTTAVADDPLIPRVTGTETVGSTLTTSNGTWTGAVVPVTLTMTGARYEGYPILGIQDALRYAGYKTPRTGVYDARTVADVIKFQKSQDLVADGQVGRKTWAKMRALTTVATPAFTYRWLRCSAPILVKPILSPTLAPTSCTVISGATDSTYVLSAADRGKAVIAEVSATNVRETPKVRWSISTALIP